MTAVTGVKQEEEEGRDDGDEKEENYENARVFVHFVSIDA